MTTPKASPHGGFILAGTISHGTLRSADLLRAFADEYERLLPFNSRDLVSEARDKADAIDAGHATDDEIAFEIVQELADAINRLVAPHGFYFGTTESDGSDFGTWPAESDDYEE